MGLRTKRTRPSLAVDLVKGCWPLFDRKEGDVCLLADLGMDSRSHERVGSLVEFGAFLFKCLMFGKHCR